MAPPVAASATSPHARRQAETDIAADGCQARDLHNDRAVYRYEGTISDDARIATGHMARGDGSGTHITSRCADFVA